MRTRFTTHGRYASPRLFGNYRESIETAYSYTRSATYSRGRKARRVTRMKPFSIGPAHKLSMSIVRMGDDWKE